MKKSMIERILDLFFPPVCAVCGKSVDQNAGLCPNCFSKLCFITDPVCDKCGCPTDAFQNQEKVCAACLLKSEPWHKARSVVVYNDISKQLILPFKHADKLQLTPLLVRLLLQQKTFIQEHDMIVPVPLHWTRMIKRRYNQAALLARAVSKETGVRFDPNVLKRTRATVSQGHLSPKQRHQNVRNAFCVPPNSCVKGKRILLTDDVMTSGATMRACATVLLKAGADRVDVLTFAKVLKNSKESICETD